MKCVENIKYSCCALSVSEECEELLTGFYWLLDNWFSVVARLYPYFLEFWALIPQTHRALRS